MAELYLRPATQDDADRLRAWRNDPLTRRNSRHPNPVSAATHAAWLAAALADPNRLLMIAEQGGHAVGTVRADRDGVGWLLSWTVAPAARGRGIGRAMVAELVGRLDGEIRAEVMADNAASRRIAEAVGLRLVRRDGDWTYWATPGCAPAKGAANMEIAGRPIGPDHPPYVIAELSANHRGDKARALDLLAAAAATGVDAVKLQTYTPDSMTLDLDGPGFCIEGGPWHGRTLYDLYCEAQTPFEWHEELFAKGRELGVAVFSTPFDETAVDLLEGLEAPAYKIASFEAVDLALIERVARTAKPMIISTGMADAAEIGQAVAAARSAGCAELALLHCVSGYPTPPEESNLNTLSDMAERFGTLCGLSDHSLGSAAAVAAVALGACIIEKHFTMRRAEGGPDAAFSLEPPEFERLVEDARTAWSALGRVTYDRKPSEQQTASFRRSLYVVRDVSVGEVWTPDNVRSIRPGHGLAPKFLNEVLGKRASRNVSCGTPMDWSFID